METIRNELLSAGVESKNVIYLDLEKRKYRKVRTDDQLEALIDSQSDADGTKYLFVDEIQNVKNFEEIINACREDGEFSIFIAGSSSYLLSGELATKLTGRYVEFELFPLSFDEYLGMRAFYGKDVEGNLQAELNSYLQEGGFSKSIQYSTLADKRTYVTSVINEIFEKDIRKMV